MNPLLVYMVTPLVIWVGVFGYLFWLDMRLRAVEKRMEEEVHQ